MKHKWIKPETLLAAGILAAVLVVNVIFTHDVFTEPFPGRNDFLSRWEGARSFWVDGVSPYSEQATLNIQQRIYGRAVTGNEDPGLFVYPFYTVFLVWPTVYMEYAWADAVWMVFLEVCLLSAMFLLLDLYNFRPGRILLIALLIWSLADYFAGRGLFLGQPSHVIYVLEILALWALYRGYDGLAGAALAVSTIKPQMGWLMVPFLLLWGLRENRRRFVMAFGVTLAVLLAASFTLEPSWFGDWIEQMRLYPEYTSAAYPDTGSPVWIITRHYLGLGPAGEWFLNLALIVPLASAWYSVLVQRKRERFLWAAALTLVVTHLVALRTATPHYVVFNLMLVFYLREMRRLYGTLAAAGVLLALLAFSWAFFVVTVQGRGTLEHPALFLPLPFAYLAILWATRRLWWTAAPVMPEPAAEAGV